MTVPPRREAALAAAVLVVTAAAVTAAWQWSGDAITDIPLYRTYGERVADGLVPYRDFGFEYPPGALPALVAPALVTDSLTAYRVAFAAQLAAIGAVAVLLLAATLVRLERSPSERRAALVAVALAPLPLGGVILARFDLLPSALVVGALALVVAGRDRAGALVTGLGIAVKLYPAVLVPLLAVAAYRRGGKRELATTLALAAAPAIVLYLPFFVLSPGGVLDSFGRQLGRPLQIESLGAGILLAVHQVADTTLGWASGAGSQNLTGPGTIVVAVVQGAAQVAAVGLVWLSFARGPATTERLVRHAAAAVVAFVALSKVLSPQFLVWLVLLVPLVGRPRGRPALGLTLLACALTAAWFPLRYWELVREFDPLASWLVLARGLTLLALLLVLVRRVGEGEARLAPTAREREQGRSPSPAPSPGRT